MLPERIVSNFSKDTSFSLIEFGKLFHNIAAYAYAYAYAYYE